MKKFVYLLLFSVTLPFSLFSQRTLRFTELSAPLKEAENFTQLGLFEKANAVLLALPVNLTEDTSPYESQLAAYLMKLCNLHLNKQGAEKSMRHFLDTVQVESIRQMATFQFARYYFDKQNFESAIPFYEQTGIECLTNKEISERNFELGYSYLVTQQLYKVKPLFASVKNIPGEYFEPGNYYHGLLSYYNKNYAEAKSSFQKVENNPRYQNVIPFYLVEIDYLTGDVTQAEKGAMSLLKSQNKIVYHNELNQILGQINFDRKNYPLAEKYFATYLTECQSPRKEDYFRLGYAQYQQLKHQEAIQQFEKMNKGSDSLSSMAWYYLATCYLRIGDKGNALTCLKSCLEFQTNPQVLEVVSYNLSKLSYELGNDQEAETQFNSFKKNYPHSKYLNEIIELSAYLQLRDARFDEAIASIQQIDPISSSLKKVYQKANYARGLQMLTDNQTEKATFYLNESKRYPMDKQTSKMTDFWLSESQYRSGLYPASLSSSEAFLSQASENEDAESIRKIHFLRSYIYLNQNDQENLIQEFSQVADTNISKPTAVLGSVKSNYTPERIPIIENEPYLIVYNLPEMNPHFVYSPVPLKPLAMEGTQTENAYPNYIKLGFGNLSTINFETAYLLNKEIGFPLYLDFTHTSSTGSIAYQQFSQTHLGATSLNKTDKVEVETQIAFDKNKQYYYGYNHVLYDYSNTDIKQTFSNFGIRSKIKPLKKNRHDINYLPEVYLGLYKDKFGANELSFTSKLPFEKIYDRNTTLRFALVADLNRYAVSDFKVQNNSMLSFQPSITKRWQDITLNLGLYPTLGKTFQLLPDITLNYPISQWQSVLTIGWQSKLILNTFKELTQQNPFIFNTQQVKQSTRQELFGSLAGNLSKNLYYSVKSGFGFIRNLPLFINDTAFDFKQFNVVYDQQATSFILDASVNYVVNKNLFAGIKMNLEPILNLSTQKEAWHYIPAKIDLFGKIKATPNVILRTDLFLRAGPKVIEKANIIQSAYTKSLGSSFDMNIAANYIIRQDWNLSIDINNLFSSKYQRWYGYQPFGTNVQVGLCYSFNKIKLIKQ